MLKYLLLLFFTLIHLLSCSSPTDSDDSSFIERLELITDQGGVKLALACSPDGKQIAYTRQVQAAYINQRDRDGDFLDTVSRFAGEMPCVSPSQQQLVYVNPDGYLAIQDLNTAKTRVLDMPRQGFRFPQWSPDEQFIAYGQKKDQYASIGIYNVQTGSIRSYELNVELLSSISYSMDGDKILSVADYYMSSRNQLGILDINSSSIKRYEFESAVSNPVLTPDNNLLFFQQKNEQDQFELKVIDFVTNETRLLADSLAEVSPMYWHDGDKELYLYANSLKRKYEALFEYSLRYNSFDDRYSSRNQAYYDIQWHADGSSFYIVHESWPTALFLYNLENQTITPLAKKYRMFDCRSPNWSADSKRLIFTLDRKPHLLDLESGKVENLSLEKTESPFDIGHEYHPDFVPGSDYVSYLVGHRFILRTIESDDPLEITTPNLSNIENPTWSPSGKYLACLQGWNVSIFRFDDEKLSLFKNYHDQRGELAWSPVGPDEASLLLYRNGKTFTIRNPFKSITRSQTIDFDVHSYCWSQNGKNLLLASHEKLYRAILKPYH